MSITVNQSAISAARAAIKAGRIDHGEWDGDAAKSEGAHNCAAEEGDEAKYPIMRGGKVSMKGLATALTYAKTKGGGAELVEALQGLDDAINAKKQKDASFHCFSLDAPNIAARLDPGLGDVPAPIIDSSGIPHTFFWKDVVPEGIYTHPEEGWTVDARGDKLDRMMSESNRLIDNGTEIPMPVDHSKKAEANKGWTRKFKIANGEDGKRRIYGLCEMVGDDAPLLAARNRVSPGIAPAFKDAKNHQYTNVIRHVAITSHPVIPGQEAFKRASFGRVDVPIEFSDGPIPLTELTGLPEDGRQVILQFSEVIMKTETPQQTNTADETRKIASPVFKCLSEGDMAGALLLFSDGGYSMLRCHDSTMNTLHDLVPGLKDVPPHEKLRHMASHLQTMHSMGRMSRMSETVPEETRDTIQESREVIASNLIDDGKLTPICAKKILALGCNDKGKLMEFSFVKDAEGKNRDAVSAVLRILSENRPVKMREESAGQVLQNFGIVGDEESVSRTLHLFEHGLRATLTDEIQKQILKR
jgi:hypothetical protein